MSDNTEIGLNHLIELKSAIETEFLERYNNNLEAIHSIESKTKLKDSTPLIELSKLSKLLRSHSTKLGIILKPATFTEKNYEATYKELKSLIDTTFYLFSLLPLLYKGKKHTKLLLERLDESMLRYLTSLTSLCKELDSKFNNKEFDEERLVCIGMIWSCCDSWDEISKLKDLGMLANSFKSSSQLIRDVIEEVDEFLEDPEGNIGQKLDFLDDDDDLDSSEDIDVVLVEKQDKSPVDTTTEDLVKLILPIMKEWKRKVILIRTLFNSFRNVIMSKDPPKIYTIDMLDNLNELHKSIAASADNFTCTIYMADETFTKDDINEEVEEINSKVKRMLSIIRNIKKKPSDKNEFVNVWETKFFENSTL